MRSARRRQVLRAAALALLLPRPGRSQVSAKARRIGVLMPSTAAATADLIAAFEQGLREHGYAPGSDVAVEYRYSEGRAGRVPVLASELARSAVAVIVSTTDGVVQAIKRHAPRTPIVMVNTSDPVGSGLVETLARPGGNVTGITNLSPEISVKRLELLKEAVAGLARVAYLWNPGLAAAAEAYREIEAGARRLGLELRSVEARRVEDIAPALAAAGSGPQTALLVQAPNPVLYTARTRVAQLALERRLPSMFNRWEYVAAGGMMSYGPSVPQMYRRAASYVDRILKGARPGELAVEQPSHFELAINTGTARALAIGIPRSVLLRADRTLP
jgi:putative ABC transport system substrate-binding protein